MKSLSLLFRFKFRYNMGLTQLAAYMRTGPKAVLLSVLGMLLAAMILALVLSMWQWLRWSRW